MKVFEVSEFGIENLRVVDREPPKAGEGQVVVRMHAWSINYRDLMVIRGEYNPKMKRPMVPFSDGAGVVVESGPGMQRIRTGDRVIGAFMQEWISGEPDEAALRSALGGAIDGVAAEYVLFDAEGLVRIPDYLTFEEAAALPCAAVTAWHALVTAGQLRREETVLLQGTGGVSMFALQFAKLIGATVIATSSKAEKLERVKAMGVDLVINYAGDEDWHKTARDYTGGRGVDHIVEVGGVATLGKSMKAIRPGGTIYVIGVLSGRGEIDFTPVFMRGLRLQGIYVGSREMAEDMLRAMTAQEIRPVIDRVFPSDKIADALRYMESGSHMGKIVISVNQ